jgi:hypothetical protein
MPAALSGSLSLSLSPRRLTAARRKRAFVPVSSGGNIPALSLSPSRVKMRTMDFTVRPIPARCELECTERLEHEALGFGLGRMAVAFAVTSSASAMGNITNARSMPYVWHSDFGCFAS